MWAVEVVVTKPERQVSVAVIRSGIVTTMNPLTKSGLDKTFGLAVGAWCIRPSEDEPDVASAAELTKAKGTVAGTVVGEDTAEADAVASVETEGGVEEADSGTASLIGIHLGVSDAGVVVDGDVEILVAETTSRPTYTVGVQRETVELLDIEVQQIARCGVFVAERRRSRFEIT
jgi:hypothetical protein